MGGRGRERDMNARYKTMGLDPIVNQQQDTNEMSGKHMFADVVSKALREIITSICRSKVLIRSMGNSLTGKSSRVADKRDEDYRELDDPKGLPKSSSLHSSWPPNHKRVIPIDLKSLHKSSVISL